MNDHLFDNKLLELRWRWLWARCESGIDAYPPTARAWLELRLARRRAAAWAFLRSNTNLSIVQRGRALAASKVLYPPLARFNRRPL